MKTLTLIAMYAAQVGIIVCPIALVLDMLVGNYLYALLMLGCTFLNLWSYRVNKNRLENL